MSHSQHPIFVYGTLMTGESAHPLLACSLESVEPASLAPAALLSLGAYPMLVDGAGTVRGELCRISPGAYAEMLTRLDRYEGPQYARELRTVHVAGDDDAVEAWVYVGRETPRSATPWPSGDWRNRPQAHTS